MPQSQNISYAVARFAGVRQFFLTGVPAENFICTGDDTQGHGLTVPDWPRQIRSLLEGVLAVLERENVAKTVVMSSFFLADIGKKELVRSLVAEIMPKHLGASTFIPQAPASGGVIALELWAVGEIEGEEGGAETKISYATDPFGHVATAKFAGLHWFFGGDNRPGADTIGAYGRSFDAFHRLNDQLRQHRFSVERLVRTWIYQGHLVLQEGDTQRYRALNRARSDFFHDHGIEKYPASTGIGADDMDVTISTLAVQAEREDFKAVPLENPNQTSAFDYGPAYSPQSPKFARAMALAVDRPDKSCLIFISGTASITESESRHLNDAAAQTELTLDNITHLIDGRNLARHGLHGFRSDLSNLTCVRVYVKRPKDFATIRAICEKRLGNVPILYTIADICRPELLVEIEGFAAVNQ